MNLETRIEKLELRITEDMDASNVNWELYDVNGGKVDDATLLRMPQKFETGLVVLSNGVEKEISAEGSWKEIIFGAEKFLNEVGNDFKPDPSRVEKEYADKLFLRRDGKMSAVEIIYGTVK